MLPCKRPSRTGLLWAGSHASKALPISVPQAPAEVQQFARYVTTADGGRGAIREITDLVLKSSRRYGLALQRLTEKAWQPRPDETAGDSNPGVIQ